METSIYDLLLLGFEYEMSLVAHGIEDLVPAVVLSGRLWDL